MSKSNIVETKCLRPPIDETIAAQIITRIYGFKVHSIQELNSYQDRNYLVVNQSGRKYVFKVTNEKDSKRPQLIDATNDILLHLDMHEIKVPKPVPVTCIPTNDSLVVGNVINSQEKNNIYVWYESLKCSQNCGPHAVRLLDYVDGKLLKDVPCTQQLLEECGVLVATMSNALQNYHKPIDIFKQRYDPYWSMVNISNVKVLLETEEKLFEASKQKLLILNAITQFEEKFLSRIDEFKHGLIHNDLNTDNILIKRGLDGKQHAHGIIDLNDVEYAPVIYDLMVMLTYISFSLQHEWCDPLIASAFAIKGYKSVRRIEDDEFELIPTFMCARIVQALVLCKQAYLNDPSNEDYLLEHQEEKWQILERLSQCKHQQLLNEWIQIIDK